MSTIWDLVGLEEVEISNDRIISLKGRCRASDFKKHPVEVVDDDVCDC
jgi:hypothetical protein